MGREKDPADAKSSTEKPIDRSLPDDRGAGVRPKTDGPGLSAGIPDLFRRAMALGLSGFFTTEETIRKALGDTLPREWVDFAAEQSERTRSDFTQRLSEEFGRVMEKVELVDLMERLLEGRTIEITAQIRLGERQPASASEPGSREGPAELQLRVAGKEKTGK